MKKTFLNVFIVSLFLQLAQAETEKKDTRGLLPDFKLTQSESENDKKALQSELVITRAENKAIETLQVLIAKRKGSPEESHLWFRLAELYMKRSKSGRFFDLHRNTKLLQLSPFPIAEESGAQWLRKATQIYFKIEKEFPKYSDMDMVLFNNAFAHQQLNLRNVSENLYRKLMQNHPKSPLIMDATVALGELLYEQQKFAQALQEFLKIEPFPQARVYSYAMYKAAWSFYNNKQTEEGITRLLMVIKANPQLGPGQVPNNRHHLRREALRDLTVFLGDSRSPGELYSFFKKQTTGDELDEAMRDLSKLYTAHSRHKDLNIFLNDYLSENISSPMVVEANLALVEANESLKQRELVLKHLGEAAELCKPTSRFAKQLSADKYKTVCQEGFRRQSLDIASRWWEIWLKNKSHSEFSKLTERVFELLLVNEDPANPDYKARFALAELNFQKENYSSSAKHYEKAFLTSPDKELAHNALYGAIYSQQKVMDALAEGKDLNKLRSHQLSLADAYLTQFPTGNHYQEVLLQKALLLYALKQNEQAEPVVQDLLKRKNINKEYLVKAQDLWLDLLNAKKDFISIKKDAEGFKTGANPERQKNLDKIAQQAHLAHIQTMIGQGDKLKAAGELEVFVTKNKDSDMAKDVLWQALAIQYADGNPLKGAELALNYADRYPTDSKTNTGLKEAANTYALAGRLDQAARITEKLVSLQKDEKDKLRQIAADYYFLEKDYLSAQRLYSQILATAPSKDQSSLHLKLLQIAKAQNNNKEVERLTNLILQRGYEPMATEFLLEKALSHFDKGQLAQAFELSLKINARDVSPLVRAPARLLQARILEQELIQQSVKSRLDRLAVVLSLKTEKLDKAHTAYLAAAKMTDSPAIKLEALEGIDRIYANYIDSIQNLPVPAELGQTDKEGLINELKALIEPIKNRKLENEAQLALLNKARSTGKVYYANLLLNETVRPVAQYPLPEHFKSRMDIVMPQLKGNKKYLEELSRLAQEALKSKEKDSERALILSWLAESQNKPEKALWLADTQLQKDKDNVELLYQRSRLVYKIDKNIDFVKDDFVKLADMKMSSPELTAFSAVSLFLSGQYGEAVKKFSSLSLQDVYTYGGGHIFSEAWAQTGNVDKALEVSQKQNSASYVTFESLLQEAHLWETYKNSPAKSLVLYQKALKMAQEQNAKAWLQSKIEYLKDRSNTVSTTVSTAGSY